VLAVAEQRGVSDNVVKLTVWNSWKEERHLHIRIANGKANMGPLGKASWLKLVVENLPNGDEVACASPWKPMDPFLGVTAADMHKCRALAQTGGYRLDSRSEDWVGYMIADVLNVNVAYGVKNDPKDLARVKQILQIWFKKKVLVTEKRRDSGRKERTFVIPGPWSDTEEILRVDLMPVLVRLAGLAPCAVDHGDRGGEAAGMGVGMLGEP
jgi:hypothetical protein